jgi:hypothetical protein
MYYIGLDIHVKDASGQIYQQGKVAGNTPRPRRLDEGASPTLDGGYGSYDLHGLDLRSPETARCSGESSASPNAAGDRRIEAPFSVIFEQCSGGNKRPDEARFNLNHSDISQ